MMLNEKEILEDKQLYKGYESIQLELYRPLRNLKNTLLVLAVADVHLIHNWSYFSMIYLIPLSIFIAVAVHEMSRMRKHKNVVIAEQKMQRICEKRHLDWQEVVKIFHKSLK